MTHEAGGRRRHALRLCVLALAGALLATPAAPAGADTCEGVWVVVDASELGAGIQTRCAPGDPSSGLEALEAAGFSYTFVPRHPGMVCTIDGRPDPCNNAPSDAHWSYWHAQQGGNWQYSSTGAHQRDPAPGTVEGWAFGAGDPPRTAPPADDPEPTDDAPADDGDGEDGTADGGGDDSGAPATGSGDGDSSSDGSSSDDTTTSDGTSSSGTSDSGTSDRTTGPGDEDQAEASGPTGSDTTGDPTANEDPTREDEPTDEATTEEATTTARASDIATPSPTPSATPTEDTVALAGPDRADGLGGLLLGAVLVAGIAAAALVRARGRTRGEPST